MKKIITKAKIFSLIGMLTIALAGIVALLPASAMADKTSKGDLPLVDGETQLFPGYPRHFDGVGHIDRIGQKEIVISDDLRVLSSGADLHTPRSSSAGIGRFAVGDYVGYQLDDSGAIESLWLLQKGKR